MDDKYEFLDDIGLDTFDDITDPMIRDYVNKHLIDDLYGDYQDLTDKMLSVREFISLVSEAILQSWVLRSRLRELRLYVESVIDWYSSLNYIGRIQIITGPIADRVEHPNPNVLYLQHTWPDDKSYTLYIWSNNEWLSVLDPNSVLSELIMASDYDKWKDYVSEFMMKRIDQSTIHEFVNNIFNNLRNEE